MNPKDTARSLGAYGEADAARYLEQRGLKIVARHFQTRYGELDLICRDKDTWVFVEVKTRTRAAAISALDALTPAKQRKLIGAALSYMKKNRLTNAAMRFDVLTFEGDQVQWIPGAFEASSHYTF